MPKKDKIDDLEKKVDYLTKLILKAYTYASDDPEIALMQARKSAEAMMRNIFEAEIGTPGKIMLDELIKKLVQQKIIPHKISIPLGTIQVYGNYGSHDQSEYETIDDAGYIEPCIAALKQVTNWFFLEYLEVNIPEEILPFTETIIGTRAPEIIKKEPARILPEKREKIEESDIVIKNITDSTKNKYEWASDEKGYWFYINGESIKNTFSNWIDNDLLVYVPIIQKYFLFKDYQKNGKNVTRAKAEISPLKLNGTAIYRTIESSYWIYVEGIALTKTKNVWIDEKDLLVFDEEKENYYFFNNYSENKDNVLREAERIPSEIPFLYRHKDTSYWFYSYGEQIAKQTISGWAGNYDYFVYVPDTKKYYLLKNYKNNADNKLYPVSKIIPPSEAFYLKSEGSYWLIKNGLGFANETTNVWIDDDLLVFHIKEKQYYLLENYGNIKENTFHATKKIDTDNEAIYRAKDGSYWLFLNGESIAKRTTNTWVDDDLIVFDPKSRKYFFLKDYNSNQDGILRPAQSLDYNFGKKYLPDDESVL